MATTENQKLCPNCRKAYSEQFDLDLCIFQCPNSNCVEIVCLECINIHFGKDHPKDSKNTEIGIPDKNTIEIKDEFETKQRIPLVPREELKMWILRCRVENYEIKDGYESGALCYINPVPYTRLFGVPSNSLNGIEIVKLIKRKHEYLARFINSPDEIDHITNAIQVILEHINLTESEFKELKDQIILLVAKHPLSNSNIQEITEHNDTKILERALNSLIFDGRIIEVKELVLEELIQQQSSSQSKIFYYLWDKEILENNEYSRITTQEFLKRISEKISSHEERLKLLNKLISEKLPELEASVRKNKKIYQKIQQKSFQIATEYCQTQDFKSKKKEGFESLAYVIIARAYNEVTNKRGIPFAMRKKHKNYISHRRAKLSI